ncbi:MAG: hypothetical protein KH202_09225 [Clostridiales bacterium]|nr:hypothetical protein [Clostridiales bacterium]
MELKQAGARIDRKFVCPASGEIDGTEKAQPGSHDPGCAFLGRIPPKAVLSGFLQENGRKPYFIQIPLEFFRSM